MDNRYDITLRSLFKSDGKPDELVACQFTNMTADAVNQWIQKLMNECIFVLKTENNLGFEATEEEIMESFNRLVEIINETEQAHNPNSVTCKIFNYYVTVQVIFPKEEST